MTENPEEWKLAIGPILNQLTTLSDEQLLDQAWPLVSERFFAGEELGHADRLTLVADWFKTSFRAMCAEAGDRGRQVWTILQDEHNRHDLERFTLVAMFLAEQYAGAQPIPMHESVAWVMLGFSILGRFQKGGDAAPPQ